MRPRARWLVPIGVFVLAVALDQLTKGWARTALAAGRPVGVIPGFWDWELAYNPGAAFSMFPDGGARVVLAIIGAIALVVIAIVFVRSPDRMPYRVGLALVAGGALGNLVDRIATGVVTDFVRWRWHDHRWPVFNVADVALAVGVVLLLVGGRRQRAPRGDVTVAAHGR